MNFYMFVIPLVSIALEWQLAVGDSDKCQRLKPMYDSFECRTCKGGNSNFYKCSKFFKNYNSNKCYFDDTQYDVGTILPGTYPNQDGTKTCVYICTFLIFGVFFVINNCTDTTPVFNPNECLYNRLYNQDLFNARAAPVYRSIDSCPMDWRYETPFGINETCTGNPDMCCNYRGTLMPFGQKFQVNGIDCFCNCPPLAECIKSRWW